MVKNIGQNQFNQAFFRQFDTSGHNIGADGTKSAKARPILSPEEIFKQFNLAFGPNHPKTLDAAEEYILSYPHMINFRVGSEIRTNLLEQGRLVGIYQQKLQDTLARGDVKMAKLVEEHIERLKREEEAMGVIHLGEENYSRAPERLTSNAVIPAGSTENQLILPDQQSAEEFINTPIENDGYSHLSRPMKMEFLSERYGCSHPEYLNLAEEELRLSPTVYVQGAETRDLLQAQNRYIPALEAQLKRMTIINPDSESQRIGLEEHIAEAKQEYERYFKNDVIVLESKKPKLEVEQKKISHSNNDN